MKRRNLSTEYGCGYPRGTPSGADSIRCDIMTWENRVGGLPVKQCKLLAVIFLSASTFLTAQALPPSHVDDFSGKPRVVIISDIGNEPDDQMSFVRLLLYSNQLDLEAMIATTSTWQRTITHPETMRQLIEAYGQVRPNLLLHARGWPEAADLAGRVFTGQSAYGLAATGNGKTTEGAQAILRAADRDDPRPLWICIWGGANTLAQALIEARATRTPEQLAK